MLRWILSLSLPLLIGYICFCIAISGCTLGLFAKIIQDYLATPYDYKSEVLMVMAQVPFQWIFMTKSTWVERKRYALIALTVSMIGSLMIIPIIVYNDFFSVSVLFATIYFFIVVGLIFILHHTIIISEKFPSILTYTWVLYRSLLLVYLTFPRGSLYVW